MTQLTWPQNKYKVSESQFFLDVAAFLSTSPYTGSHKALLSAQVWRVEMNLVAQTLEEAQDLQAFIDKLEGPTGTMLLYDHWRTRPLGTLGLAGSGTIESWSDGTFWTDGTGWGSSGGGADLRVKTAAARGDKFITIKNFPVSEEVLKSGDLLEVNNRVYETIGMVTSDSAGDATVEIRPGLRVPLIPEDPVNYDHSRGTFRLVPGSGPTFSRRVFHGKPVSLSFVEDIP